MVDRLRSEFIKCPRCGQNTRTKVLPHTVLIEFPLFCPKCKYELIVSFRNGILTTSATGQRLGRA
ncbi:MAG: cysteine-rich KTR domain-containing protein [Coriobacteriales bacterium]|nr:cysteine-rich KTR domain-containing protein [Coriobacteriales bacterium]